MKLLYVLEYEEIEGRKEIVGIFSSYYRLYKFKKKHPVETYTGESAYRTEVYRLNDVSGWIYNDKGKTLEWSSELYNARDK